MATQPGVRGEPQERRCLDQTGLWACLAMVALMTYCKKAKPTVGGTFPTKVALGYIKMLVEHKSVRESPSKQHSSVISASSPGLESLPLLSQLVSCVPFLPRVVSDTVPKVERGGLRREDLGGKMYAQESEPPFLPTSTGRG